MKHKYKYSLLEKILFPSVCANNNKLKYSLNGKTVLITGASYGIGESLALKLAMPSVTIILIARTEEKLKELKNKIEQKGGKALYFSANLYNQNEVEEIIDFLKKEELKPDIFISNAGKSIKRSIFDSLDRFHDFSRTMNINYFAPVKLLLHLIPNLVTKNGQILSVSTMNALLPPVNLWAAYSASKTAFDTWLGSIEPELENKNVVVSSLYLPLVRTRMIAPTKAYDKMPAMKPEHVADIICRMIIKKKKKYAPWWKIFAQISALLFRKKWKNYKN